MVNRRLRLSHTLIFIVFLLFASTSGQLCYSQEGDKAYTDELYDMSLRQYNEGNYVIAKIIAEEIISVQESHKGAKDLLEKISKIEKDRAGERDALLANISNIESKEKSAVLALIASELKNRGLDENAYFYADRSLAIDASNELAMGIIKERDAKKGTALTEEKPKEEAPQVSAENAGAQEAVTQPPAAVNPDSGKEKAEKILEKYSREAVIEKERDQLEIKGLIESGIILFGELDFKQAKEKFKKVIALDPENAEAKKYVDEIESIEGLPISRIKDIAKRKEAERLAEGEMVKIDLERMVHEGEALMAEGKHKRALEKFDAALEIITWIPPYVELPAGYKQQIEGLIEKARIEEGVKEGSDRQAKLKEAKQLAVQEARRLQEFTEARIDTLLAKAKEHYYRKEYSKTIDLVNQVLRNYDPLNKDAKSLKEQAEEESYSLQRAMVKENNEKETKKQWANIEDDSIPWISSIVYPDDWSEKMKRTGKAVKEAPKEEWERDIEKKLQEKVDLTFTSAPLSTVLDELRNKLSVNIITDDSVDINKTVDLNVKDIEFSAALGWILRLTGLDMKLYNEAIYISTPEKIAEMSESAVVRLYDVRPLLVGIKDFPGRAIDLDRVNSAAQGGGGQGIFTEEETTTDKGVVTGEELADIVKSSVAVNTWAEQGNSIEYRDGNLVVTNKPEAHKKIEAFLSELRKTKQIQVSIETRFLYVTNHFYEDYGISWSGLDSFAYQSADNARSVLPGFVNARGKDFDIRAEDYNVFPVSVLPAAYNSDWNGGLFGRVFHLDDYQADALIHAAYATDQGVILNSPRVTCFDGQRANLTVQTQHNFIQDVNPVVAEDSVGADPTIATVADGVVLDVRPTVSENRRYITLEIQPQLATIINMGTRSVPVDTLYATIQLPEIQIDAVRTTVTIPDGGTMLLGGLKRRTQAEVYSGIPVLCKIPLIKYLFGAKAQSDDKENLLILVRAEIILLDEEEAKLPF